MRHNVAHRKLGRVTEHRLALLRNQAIALLRHEKIETTMPKAKELRPFVERLITIAKRGVAAGDAERQDAARAPAWCSPSCPTSDVVGKLFETLAPRFAERPGGYTRILRVGFRRGDSAEVAHIELVGSEYNPAAKTEKEEGDEEAPKKAKGVGERLKRAAQRMRGGKGEGGSKAQAGGQTRRRGAEEHDAAQGRRLLATRQVQRPTSELPRRTRPGRLTSPGLLLPLVDRWELAVELRLLPPPPARVPPSPRR